MFFKHQHPQRRYIFFKPLEYHPSMARRTYHQHCALARALDLVGERWTLLLVRELVGGARRYGELLENLPGMGTNLLANRLRDLQEAGIVEHEDPAYRLTERGQELEPALVALARWGAPLLDDPRPGALWRASWNVLALQYAFRPERARKLRGVLEWRIDASVVQARIREGTIETSGETRWRPDVVITTDGETLLGVWGGDVAVEDAEASGSLEIDGDRRLFRTSLRVFARD